MDLDQWSWIEDDGTQNRVMSHNQSAQIVSLDGHIQTPPDWTSELRLTNKGRLEPWGGLLIYIVI